MTIALISHPDCLLHDADLDHPECPERLRVISKALVHADLEPFLTHEIARLLRVNNYTEFMMNNILTAFFNWRRFKDSSI